jgi:hypothetical protein
MEVIRCGALGTGTELDATECAEVAGVELGGGTDLGRDRGRWMERSCDGRREYGRGARGSYIELFG